MLRLLFKRFRSEEQAKAALGVTIEFEGHTWKCIGHNDLGCLYWQRSDWTTKSVYWEPLDRAAGFPQL